VTFFIKLFWYAQDGVNLYNNLSNSSLNNLSTFPGQGHLSDSCNKAEPTHQKLEGGSLSF
jgi:hypothetical protein